MGYNSSGGGVKGRSVMKITSTGPGLNRDPVEINSVSSMLLAPVVGCTWEAPEEAINLSSERGGLRRREVIGIQLPWDFPSVAGGIQSRAFPR